MLPQRPLGATGVSVSPVIFGCGTIGGIFTTDSHTDEQDSAVRQAWDLGVTWFDTAPQYGNGRSEINLAAALLATGLADTAFVSTRVRVTEDDLRGDIRSAIMRSTEASLERLGTDHVDLFQLQNRITEIRGTQPDALSMADVLGENGALETLERLRSEGACSVIGMTALGDTEPLRIVVQASGFQTARIVYNLLNPTVADRHPDRLPVHDYGQLLDTMADRKMGVIATWVHAGGALADQSSERRPGPVTTPAGLEFERDLERASALVPLAQEYETTVSRAALRFVLHDERVAAAVIGVSNIGQIETVVEAFDEGALHPEFVGRWRGLLESDFGRADREDDGD